MPHVLRLLVVAILLTGLGAACKAQLEAPPEALPALPQIGALERPVEFERDVKPVLEARCIVCHA